MRAKPRGERVSRSGLGRLRRGGAFAAAGALILAAVAACGNGGGSTGGGSASANGFKPAAQTGGPLTVWVDSDRLQAAKLYQQQHPEVKMNIVTYDGDANGSNYLQTKVEPVQPHPRRVAGRRVLLAEQRGVLGRAGRASSRRSTRA